MLHDTSDEVISFRINDKGYSLIDLNQYVIKIFLANGDMLIVFLFVKHCLHSCDIIMFTSLVLINNIYYNINNNNNTLFQTIVNMDNKKIVESNVQYNVIEN